MDTAFGFTFEGTRTSLLSWEGSLVGSSFAVGLVSGWEWCFWCELTLRCQLDYLRLVSKDDGYWRLGPEHCGSRAREICVVGVSSLVGMQKVSIAAARLWSGRYPL
jgi:hypothetical protein